MGRQQGYQYLMKCAGIKTAWPWDPSPEQIADDANTLRHKAQLGIIPISMFIPSRFGRGASRMVTHGSTGALTAATNAEHGMPTALGMAALSEGGDMLGSDITEHLIDRYATVIPKDMATPPHILKNLPDMPRIPIRRPLAGLIGTGVGIGTGIAGMHAGAQLGDWTQS